MKFKPNEGALIVNNGMVSAQMRKFVGFTVTVISDVPPSIGYSLDGSPVYLVRFDNGPRIGCEIYAVETCLQKIPEAGSWDELEKITGGWNPTKSHEQARSRG